MNVPAGDVDTALDLLADILQHSSLAEDALEREKRLVALEIERRLGNPSEVASDLLYGTLFEGHPLGRPIVGNPESIAALDRAELLDARDRYYVASNLVLAVVGRVRAEDVLTRVEQHFGAMAPGGRNWPEAAPDGLAGVKAVEERAGRQQAIVQLAVRGPAAGHPDRYPFMVLDDVLGLVSGRIFTEVRVKRGLAYVAGSGFGAFRDTGVWTAYAGADPQNVDEVVALLLDEMKRAREEPLTPDELQHAVSHATGHQLVGGESNAAKGQALARRETLGLPDTDESVIEAFRRVTAEDVQRVAQTYLDPERYVLAVVRP